MKYRVFWHPHAETQLEQILSNKVHLTRILAAARSIDRQLLIGPANFGESRFETVRIAFERPLAVLFEVQDDVQTVIVYEVWLIE
jgi:hypothetical protein